MMTAIEPESLKRVIQMCRRAFIALSIWDLVQNLKGSLALQPAADDAGEDHRLARVARIGLLGMGA
jgi:hypothetical protein